MSATLQSPPWKQGEAAYLAGAKSASNPWGHMHTSWAAAQWDYGWQAARDREGLQNASTAPEDEKATLVAPDLPSPAQHSYKPRFEASK
jgi:hypothetical protein